MPFWIIVIVGTGPATGMFVDEGASGCGGGGGDEGEDVELFADSDTEGYAGGGVV